MSAQLTARPEWETRNASVGRSQRRWPARYHRRQSNRQGPANYICLNKGKGRFDADCIPFSHESATTITAADFNHDGLIDLAVPNRDGGQSYVYLGGGARASYSNLKRIPFGPANATIRMAEAADLNGDGLLDIVAIDERRRASRFILDRRMEHSRRAWRYDSGGVTPYALAVQRP